MSKLILLVLYQGMVKLVGGLWLKTLTVDSRLKHTLFGGIERHVEEYEYVCLYVRYIYSELILRYKLILMQILKK